VKPENEKETMLMFLEDMHRVSKFGENEGKIWKVQGYEVIFSFIVERRVN